ncbi:MAG: helix-turn-helix domain-containing protein [Chloroflexota bacterium]
MRPPIRVHALTDAETARLRAGLRASDAFVKTCCQILLAGARGETAPRIATQLGCHEQTVRNVFARFDCDDLDATLTRRSSRPHRLRTKVDAATRQGVHALVRQSPRTFGLPTSRWTLALVAEVGLAEGILPERVSGETVRRAIRALGARWTRAK